MHSNPELETFLHGHVLGGLRKSLLNRNGTLDGIYSAGEFG
jgi:hypothetical protein